MTLTPGSHLGPYEITGKLGEGGMGEVYQATDSNLRRQVAIKVLPAAFTDEPDRLARFEREAQLLAQLQHPNIASIYGLEESEGRRALVLELVEGPTLAEQLETGALPLDEALSFARQIAKALEEAHEKGIIHRDLKPQNIKITADGKVKVLDFGLAKAMHPTSAASGESSASQLAASPTLTIGATMQGVILGTAGYMAPEQAKGMAADKRADIWAFGAVLYEMLTGSRLFLGDSVPEILAGVLKTEIDLSILPATTPPAIRRLLRRCLERHPKSRLRDIGDARIVIEEVQSGQLEVETETASLPRARGLGAIALPWLLTAGLAALLFLRVGDGKPASAPEQRRELEASVPLGSMLEEGAGLTFAPDGSSIVFTAVDPMHGTKLWLRRLDSFEAKPLSGTEGASFPFWSPDSQSIGFFRDSDASLLRYSLSTATVDVLAKTPGGAAARGASWSAPDMILLAPSSNSPIQRLTLSTGALEDVTTLDPNILDGSHRFPIGLPDGRHFLFTFWSNQLETAERYGGIYLGSFENGIERRLSPDLSQAVLAGRDRVLIRRDGALVALSFDPSKLEFAGNGERIGEQPLFATASGALAASASETGDLAFALASGQSGGQLVWLDRQGEVVGTIGSDRYEILNLALAPVGNNFAVEMVSASGGNIWVGDDRRQVMNRLTPDAVDSYFPVWSPDSRQVAFVSEAEGSLSLYRQTADSSRAAELLVSEAKREFKTTHWSSDGRYLLLESNVKGEGRTDIWLYDFETVAARELLSEGSASISQAVLSADGKWLAYVSDESGNPEIFVRSFPALDRKWKISQGGANRPHWSQDGRELLFLGLADQAIQVVEVTPDSDGIEVGIQKQLFVPSSRLLGISPRSDHSRFLAGLRPHDGRSRPIQLILGWRRAIDSEDRP